MVQIQADYASKGVQLVAINSNDASKYPEDSFPKMKERAREKHFGFPYLWDEGQEVARSYGAERTPEVFLFDKAGTLRYHGVIDDNYDDPASGQSEIFEGRVGRGFVRNATLHNRNETNWMLNKVEVSGCLTNGLEAKPPSIHDESSSIYEVCVI